jgi:hypothetical protein
VTPRETVASLSAQLRTLARALDRAEDELGAERVLAAALVTALRRFVTEGAGCVACGMEGRPDCGCRQEQGRLALEGYARYWTDATRERAP